MMRPKFTRARASNAESDRTAEAAPPMAAVPHTGGSHPGRSGSAGAATSMAFSAHPPTGTGQGPATGSNVSGQGRVVGPAPRRAPSPPTGHTINSSLDASTGLVEPPVDRTKSTTFHHVDPAPATNIRSGAADAPLSGSPLPGTTMSAGSASRERIVLLSIGLVSLAIGMMLYVQFFVPGMTAALIGAVTCTFFLLMHDRAKKNNEISRLAAELARQRSARAIVVDPTHAAGQRAASGVLAADQPVDPVTAAVDRAVATRRQEQLAAVDASNAISREPTFRDPAARDQAVRETARWEPVTSPIGSSMTSDALSGADVDRSRVVASAGSKSSAFPADARQSASGPALSASTSSPSVARDQWAFRPRDAMREPTGDLQRAVADAGTPLPSGTPRVTTIETDLALVQRKIKELADEVNGAHQQQAGEASVTVPSSAMPIDGHQRASFAIDDSIGALKSAAATMRAPPVGNVAEAPAPSGPFGDFVIPATAERIAASAPNSQGFAPLPNPNMPISAKSSALDMTAARDYEPVLPMPPRSHGPFEMQSHAGAADDELELALALPVLAALQPEPPPVDPKIKAITRAIETGSMDVMLSPIVGLMTHEVTHYDVKVLLKSDAGGYFENPTRDLLLSATDVLALFDTARLTRAAALARRLDARGKTGALLSEVTGPSLTNGGFLETFARIYEDRDRIAGQLVLTFAQADTERFSPSAWQALSDMHAFGFRFALERLDHLNVDFAALVKRGFALVKVDAGVLLSGMPSANGFIASQEVCSRIAGAGLTLIADAVDDDATRARLFGFGVLFGQGQLFGGARLVSVDPTLPGTQPSAAA